MAVRQGRSERRGEAYSEPYVKPLNDARTKPTDIFKSTIMDEDDIELPILPRLDKGPPPDCPICGDPMAFIDGDWACVDCNGELLGPETG
jgi:hypothetical protein